MRVLRSSCILALLALLLLVAAGPVAAARCRMSGYCPMMAKAGERVSCAGATGGMSAPMDCCRPTAAPAPAAMAAALESPSMAIVAVIPVAGGHAEGSVLPGPSRSGRLHALGLFTLNSVWRL